ncbi:hypothetical protein [Lysinibacillus xylanilyticus]|uniref:hypothetical protein n=1 Tax=Lysinibacillus xylanilyticus TaxID=582475 RepID=UPI003D06A4A7
MWMTFVKTYVMHIVDWSGDWTPPGSSALRESEASAANVLSARKRSVSGKADSRNGNQPHDMVMRQ